MSTNTSDLAQPYRHTTRHQMDHMKKMFKGIESHAKLIMMIQMLIIVFLVVMLVTTAFTESDPFQVCVKAKKCSEQEEDGPAPA